MFLPEMEGSSNSQNLPFQMLQKVLQITNTEILEVIMYHGACQLFKWAVKWAQWCVLGSRHTPLCDGVHVDLHNGHVNFAE